MVVGTETPALSAADPTPGGSLPARLAIAAAAYLAAQWVAFALTVHAENISIFWPPAGVMLAALVMAPRREWPHFAVLFLLATLATNWAVGRGEVLNAALSLNDVAVGAVGAALYRRLNGQREPFADYGALIAFGAVVIVSALISATVGAAIVRHAFGVPLGSVWVLRFGAMVLGIGILGPIAFAVAARPWRRLLHETNWQSLVLAGLVLGLCVAPLLPGLEFAGRSPAAALAPMLFLVLAAVLRPHFEVALFVLGASVIEIWAAAHGLGPTAGLGGSRFDQVLWVQGFLALRVGTVFILCSSVESGKSLARLSMEREARLRSVIDTVPDAIITIDERGIVQSFSPAAERMFHFAAGEVVGRNVKMLMPAYYAERHDGFLARYLATGERRIIGIGRVVVAQRRDGSTFPIELAVGEAKVDRRRLFTGFIRDISEKQETERRLQELHDELLHVSRLSALGEFASAIAHELNQPLTAISNYAQAVRDMLESPTADKGRIAAALDKAIEQTGRAGQIIRHMRGLVRKKAPAKALEDVNTLVEEASALAFVGAKEKGIRVTMNLTVGLPDLEVDKVQIQQVVINLVRNAIDALQGWERRELAVQTGRNGGGGVVISVRDSGPGVAPEAVPRLFQPFATTKESGTGIGLAISRSIVEAHGGALSYEPNPAGGAVFKVTLPIPGAAE